MFRKPEKTGWSMEMAGGHSGYWNYKLNGDLPGLLLVEQLDGEGWVTEVRDDEENVIAGMMGSSEGLFVKTRAPLIKALYTPDGELSFFAVGMSSFLLSVALEVDDDDYLDDETFKALREINERKGEYILMYFKGEVGTTEPPVWAVKWVVDSDFDGETKQSGIIDPLLIKGEEDQKVVQLRIGEISCDFYIFGSQDKIKFGVAKPTDEEVKTITFSRRIDYKTLDRRIRRKKGLEWRDVNELLLQVSPSMDLASD